MNIPNSITLFRLVLGVASAAIILAFDANFARLLSLGMFAASGALDKFDGYIARRTNSATLLGVHLDKISDQLVIWSNFIALAHNGALSHWLVILAISREVLICELCSYGDVIGKKISVCVAFHSRYLLQLTSISLGYVFLLTDRPEPLRLAADIACAASVIVGTLTLIKAIRDGWDILSG
jgi:phosphatidylglycerophosphate synthase